MLALKYFKDILKNNPNFVDKLPNKQICNYRLANGQEKEEAKGSQKTNWKIISVQEKHPNVKQCMWYANKLKN